MPVTDFGRRTSASELDTLATHDDHKFRALCPVSELNASSEMIREDFGDAIPATRSNASCGMTIRSSAAIAPPWSVDLGRSRCRGSSFSTASIQRGICSQVVAELDDAMAHSASGRPPRALPH
jgi:hypothetical protein